MIEDDTKPSDSPTEIPETSGPAAGASELRARRDRRSKVRQQGESKAGFLDSLNPWIEVLLCLVVGGSVLAVGTVHLKVLLAVAALSVVTGALAMREYRLRIGTWPMPGPAWLVLGLTAFTLFQVLPMPIWLLSVIAPSNAHVWSGALSPLGEAGPSWATISLDPTATWAEVLKGLSYFGIIIASYGVASRRTAIFGTAVVFISGILVAALTVAHGLAGLEKVYGVYEPQHAFSVWHIGPLLNTNHLCGYLNLATFCGLGLLLMKKLPIKWYFVAIGIATTVAVAVASASRAGVVLIPVGVILFTFLIRGRQFGHESGRLQQKTVAILTFAAVGGGAMLALLGATTRQWTELLDKDLSKLSMFMTASTLEADHPIWGIGRGSFETVFQAYKQTPGHVLFTHPENLVVQWSSEWGIPVALATMVGFAWLFRPSKLGVRQSAVMAGAWVGILMLVVQNWLDFSMEVPSVGLAISCVVGALWGDPSRRGLRPETRRTFVREGSPLSNAWAPLLLGVSLLLGLLGVMRHGGKTASDLRSIFAEIARKPPMGKSAFQPILRAALLRFPAEPYFPLVGAERAFRLGDEDPLPYLRRTIDRGQSYAPAQLLFGTILESKGAAKQAIVPLRSAAYHTTALVPRAVSIALRLPLDYDDLQLLGPEGFSGAQVFSALAGALNATNPAWAEKLDNQALKRDPSLQAPRERLANGIIKELQSGSDSQRCRGELLQSKCMKEVEVQASAIEHYAPGVAIASCLRASANLAIGRSGEAWRILSMSCQNVVDRLPCVQLQLSVALAQKRSAEDIDALLKQIGALGCTDSVACSQIYAWMAGVQLQQGNLGAAAKALERAVQEDPENISFWMQLGDICVQLGATSRAVHAWEQVARKRPEDEVLHRKIQTEKQKLVGTLHGF